MRLGIVHARDKADVAERATAEFRPQPRQRRRVLVRRDGESRGRAPRDE